MRSAGLCWVSVSTGLVHHAHCPVAVIHEDPPAVAPDAPVLVGIDGSPASLSAAEIAFDEASRRGVDVVALHAWRDITTMYEIPGLEVEQLEAEARLALSERLAGFEESVSRGQGASGRGSVISRLAS